MTRLGSLLADVGHGLGWAGAEVRTQGTSLKACAIVYRQKVTRLVQLCGEEAPVVEKGMREHCRVRNLERFLHVKWREAPPTHHAVYSVIIQPV